MLKRFSFLVVFSILFSITAGTSSSSLPGGGILIQPILKPRSRSSRSDTKNYKPKTKAFSSKLCGEIDGHWHHISLLRINNKCKRSTVSFTPHYEFTSDHFFFFGPIYPSQWSWMKSSQPVNGDFCGCFKSKSIFNTLTLKTHDLSVSLTQRYSPHIRQWLDNNGNTGHTAAQQQSPPSILDVCLSSVCLGSSAGSLPAIAWPSI